MRKTTALCLGVMMALGATTIATAAEDDFWGHRGPLGEHPGVERFQAERMERVAGFLELTDQQKEEWLALHEELSAGASAHRDEMRGLHERIRGLAEAEKPDAAAVGELVIEAHRKMTAHRAEGEAVHAQVLSILTPEQQERFEAMRSLRGDRQRSRSAGPPQAHAAPRRGAARLTAPARLRRTGRAGPPACRDRWSHRSRSFSL